MEIMKNVRFLALAVALAMGSGCGCHHADHDDFADRFHRDRDEDCDDDLVAGAVILGALALIAIPVAIANSGSHAESAAPARTRHLQAVHGGLVDVEGRPIAGAAITVRAAKGYTASPEKLPAVTLQSGPDGHFVIPMMKDNALCVDFAAEGKQPVRRWYIVLVPGALKGLPTDQRDIVFLSPYEAEAMVASMALAGGR
jgi:hypothetical protein